MEYNKFSSEGIFVLSQFLKDNNTLEKLDLYSNRIENEGCKHLAKAIQTNRTLGYLGLFGCKITDEGALYFLPALQNNKALKEVVLENNSISEIVLEAISHFLNRNKGLTTNLLPNVSDLIEKLIKKEDLILFSQFLSKPVSIPSNTTPNLLQVNNPIRKSSSQQNIANSNNTLTTEISSKPLKKDNILDGDELDLLSGNSTLIDKNNFSSGFEEGSHRTLKISYQSPMCTSHQQWISERDKLLQTLNQLSMERETTLHQVADLHQKVKQALPQSLYQ